ncbi:MAG TPA: NYN domain-containing protein [Pseudonocardiaceae bacterium]|jgi:uncharacterized LabA/DUF88 family protein
MDRAMVFIDYQNTHLGAHARFLPPGTSVAAGHVNPRRLADLLVARRRRSSELAAVHVYRGRPSPDRQRGSAAANDRQAAVWSRNDLVHVHRRPLRYPKDWPNAPAVEKGIDVQLAIDIVRLAIQGEYDAAIIVSHDSDLLPAVEAIQALKVAHIEVATWSGLRQPIRKPGSRSGNWVPWCHWLTEKDFDAVRDWTDYTAI